MCNERARAGTEEYSMQFGWKKSLTAVAVSGALLTISSLSTPRQLWAQAKAALVQDIDQPARGAFQANVIVNLATGFVNVPIPAGKRLVVDYVAIAGAAQSGGGGIQPVILMQSTLGNAAGVTYYLMPSQSPTAPTQFYGSEQPRIYADSLYVGTGYSGYAPSFLTFQVSISGHLVSMP